jgi:hypothetical protein
VKKERKSAAKVLMGGSEPTRPLVRPGHRCEDNIKMYLQEVVLEDMEWNDLADDIDR